MEPKSQEGKRDLEVGRPSKEIRIPPRRRIALATFVARQDISPRTAIVVSVSLVKRRKMGERENLLPLLVLVVGLAGTTRVPKPTTIVTQKKMTVMWGTCLQK
jgi:hypothetical protein